MSAADTPIRVQVAVFGEQNRAPLDVEMQPSALVGDNVQRVVAQGNLDANQKWCLFNPDPSIDLDMQLSRRSCCCCRAPLLSRALLAHTDCARQTSCARVRLCACVSFCCVAPACVKSDTLAPLLHCVWRLVRFRA